MDKFQYDLFLPVTPTGPFPDLGIVVAELVHGADYRMKTGMPMTWLSHLNGLGSAEVVSHLAIQAAWLGQTLEIVSQFQLNAEDIVVSVPLPTNLILVCLVAFCNVFYPNITVNLGDLVRQRPSRPPTRARPLPTAQELYDHNIAEVKGAVALTFFTSVTPGIPRSWSQVIDLVDWSLFIVDLRIDAGGSPRDSGDAVAKWQGPDFFDSFVWEKAIREWLLPFVFRSLKSKHNSLGLGYQPHGGLQEVGDILEWTYLYKRVLACIRESARHCFKRRS
ncbi:hypothetical protein OF83DRAFT_1084194 [Amylostereum chailletii]|nr:hypothetical protein OF83DRAFT_1084194 [Amylostereum chailletii]